MAQIMWNEESTRTLELGVSHGFLFPEGKPGVPWNGLSTIVATPVGGEAVPYYYDGEKFRNDASLEELELTLEAFSYPEGFAACNGSYEVIPGVTVNQQDRKPFNFTYRTLLECGTDLSYKMHFVYDAYALAPSISRSTSSDAPQGLIFSWPLVLIHQEVDGFAPTMHVSIDSDKIKFANFIEFENLVYGLNGNPPWCPSIQEIRDFFKYDLIALHISENEEMGISPLTTGSPKDLIGFRETGVYWRAGTSRFNETSTDGIYDLE